MEDKHTPEKFELITEQQAFENKVVGVIKNLVHRSLQWEDGEIKGWDENMITSLAPILLKPFFADLLAKVSEQEKEMIRLKQTMQFEIDANDRVRAAHKECQDKVSEQSQSIEALTKENERLQNIFDNMRGWPEEPDVMPFHEHLKETQELNLRIKALTSQVEKLKAENKELKQYTEVSTDKIDELVNIVDDKKNNRYQVLKTEIRVTNKLLNEAVSELSRLREERKELSIMLKGFVDSYNIAPIPAWYLIQSLLSKFEVPNQS